MKKRRHILQILVRSIALTLLATLAVSLVVLEALMRERVLTQAKELLNIQLDDTMNLAIEMSHTNGMVELSNFIAMLDIDDTQGLVSLNEDGVRRLADNGTKEFIDIVAPDGTIVFSTDDTHKGKSYSDDPLTKAFLETVQEQRFGTQDVDSWPLHDDQPLHLSYMPVTTSTDHPYMVVGGDAENSLKQLTFANLYEEASFRRIGEHGFILCCISDLQVLSTIEDTLLHTTLELEHDIDEICDQSLMVEETIAGMPVYVCARRLTYTVTDEEATFFLIAAYPKKEAQRSLVRSQHSLIVFVAVLYLALLVLLGYRMRRDVTMRVDAVNRSLNAITAGDLSVRVTETDSIEFEQLSRGINATVDKLEDLIEQEARRLDEELALAHTIQRTALPNMFPPFPEREDFGLFASMDPAREVGGDFYDFFLVSDDQIAVIVADVSDKGIPAALFMMRAKTAIKALAVSGLHVDEVVSRANDDLCEDNEAGMFVTAWLGILDLRTGVMEYVHAGHTCPVLVRGDATSIVKKKRNFIMGGRAHIPYARQQIELGPGDALFLYSDGVTEAFSVQEELYGSERLEEVLGRASAEAGDGDPNEYCREVCAAVRQDVGMFTAGAEQSDDITMLCIRYEGQARGETELPGKSVSPSNRIDTRT